MSCTHTSRKVRSTALARRSAARWTAAVELRAARTYTPQPTACCSSTLRAPVRFRSSSPPYRKHCTPTPNAPARCRSHAPAPACPHECALNAPAGPGHAAGGGAEQRIRPMLRALASVDARCGKSAIGGNCARASSSSGIQRARMLFSERVISAACRTAVCRAAGATAPPTGAQMHTHRSSRGRAKHHSGNETGAPHMHHATKGPVMCCCECVPGCMADGYLLVPTLRPQAT